MARGVTKAQITKKDNDSFRKKIKRILEAGEKQFLVSLQNLPPREYVDAYFKLIPYAYPKAPEEKPIEKEDKNKLRLIERERIIEQMNKPEIQAGNGDEDEEYDDEDNDYDE